MKLAGASAAAFISRPDTAVPGVLLFGEDAMRVALKRQDLIRALLGSGADADMRLTRMEADSLKRDPAAACDAMRATGFFATEGARAVLVESANDGHLKGIEGALADWRPGDAMLVITAGALKKTSKLRKVFEGHATARCIAVYDDAPSRAEIEAEMARVGLTDISPAARSDIDSLARILDPGDFRQTLEKFAVYKLGDDTPLTDGEIAALTPTTVEAETDEILNAVAEGRTGAVGPLIRRLWAQSVTPVTLVIAATRHFRALHDATTHPRGPGAALGRQRPPVFGPRRAAMEAQSRRWRPDRLEQVLSWLLETDLALRSAGQSAPQQAVVERLFIRLSMRAGR
jgi:DNA polymerase-3 subunit delta